MIHTADTMFPASGLVASERAAYVLDHWRGRPPEATALEVFVVPFVNDGRWIIQCPTCHSAAFASRDDPRFFCVDCGNADHGGAWVTVHWPPEADEIATVLDARPNSVNKNWRPGEEVADLVAENDAHDVGVADEVRGGLGLD